MRDAPKTIRVHVSAESDGYREATRASTVEVDAQEHEVASRKLFNKRAEYEDGSRAVLLEDLSTDEVDELRACVAAHEIPL